MRMTLAAICELPCTRTDSIRRPLSCAETPLMSARGRVVGIVVGWVDGTVVGTVVWAMAGLPPVSARVRGVKRAMGQIADLRMSGFTWPPS